MIITRLLLTNWRNFRSLDLPLRERMFVVGANASGKSNLLDAIRFLRDLAKESGGLQYAVATKRGGVQKIRCLAAREKSDVTVEVHLAESPGAKVDWKYRLTFRHAGGGIIKKEAKIVEEKIWNGKKGKWVVDRSEEDPKENDDSLKATFLQQPLANKNFVDVLKFFQRLQYLHVVPQLVRDADSYILTADKEDFYGKSLLERMALSKATTRNAYLSKINEVLKIAVPQFCDLVFVSDEKTGIPHLEASCLHWRAKGARQQETQFSDGTLRLIGFLWALLDGTDTILLEEPELYLHSAIVKKLPEFIARFQRKKGRVRQVLITTHSYEMLSNEGIGADELIVLKPGKEGTVGGTGLTTSGVKEYLDAGFNPADAVIPLTAPEHIDKIVLTAARS